MQLAEVTSRSRPHWKRKAFVVVGFRTDSQLAMKKRSWKSARPFVEAELAFAVVEVV